MRHGSLFTGIGGLDLALGTPAWTCERDSYARRVLAARFPGVPCYDDVTTLSGPPAVDVLTGGFPCQDLSVAGKQAGIEGARSGLWRHMLRLTDELRPKVVVAENVANLGRQIGPIVQAFAAIGYRMEATRIAASDVGAPHERMRLLVLAYREDVSIPWPVDDFGGQWTRLRGDVLVPRWVDRPLPERLWTTLTGSQRYVQCQQGGTCLQAQVSQRSTLAVKGNHNRAGLTATSGDGLATAVERWPTLRASDGRSPGASATADGTPPLTVAVRDWPTLTARDWRGGAPSQQNRNTPGLPTQVGWHGQPPYRHWPLVGPLNPAWREAFMGFPIGWTDLGADLLPGGWPMGQGPDQHEWEPPRMVAPRTVANRGERIKCLGNAVVPAVGAVAARRVLSALG